ncbi:hypothetical protein AD998_21005 [bacterium 336/3]|nr:hypothetical protein AD998_21005 [bacterium 336/3]
MVQNNLALVSGANGHLGNNLVRLLLEKGIPVRASVRNISKAREEQGFNPKPSQEAVKNAFHYLAKKQNLLAKSIIILMMSLFSLSATYAQNTEKNTGVYLSVETDPAFWIGTLPNGVGFDANINMRLAKFPRLRWGILGYSGRWSGNFGKTILLTNDFEGDDWETQWNGLGIEAQYQFRFGLKRGGLQPGLRIQWNQFLYNQVNQYKGEANHFVLTPQVGFQWFPFKKLGLYLLPWAGVQMPVLGTNKIVINQEEKRTRKLMPVITAHIGWEFQF